MQLVMIGGDLSSRRESSQPVAADSSCSLRPGPLPAQRPGLGEEPWGTGKIAWLFADFLPMLQQNRIFGSLCALMFFNVANWFKL